MKSSLFTGLSWRVVLIAAAFFVAAFALTQKFHYTALFVATIGAVLCAEAWHYIRTGLLFYDKAILAMLHNDYSAGFPQQYQVGAYQNLYKLYNRQKNIQFSEVSREMVYQSIFNNVDTGILILKTVGDERRIFLMNDYFSRYFGVPRVGTFGLLANYLPDFCAEIERSGFAERKSTVNVKLEGKEPQTFILQASATSSPEGEYYIVLLDSIQRVIEKKEKEAWINLMKIISHELMNSLTPIRSLSQSLKDILAQPQITDEDLGDVRASLSTIVNRSDHLQSFVENYRKLTMLPTPEKQAFDLAGLISESVQVMSPVFREEGIVCHNLVQEATPVFADRGQIGQVIINLLTNSMHALRDRPDKEIAISKKHEDNRLFLVISDTGKGIEPEIREKIFLPFFTTRKDGAGIGLTLSKNIIEAHGGYLSYATAGDRTQFAVCLVDC